MHAFTSSYYSTSASYSHSQSQFVFPFFIPFSLGSFFFFLFNFCSFRLFVCCLRQKEKRYRSSTTERARENKATAQRRMWNKKNLCMQNNIDSCWKVVAAAPSTYTWLWWKAHIRFWTKACSIQFCFFLLFFFLLFARSFFFFLANICLYANARRIWIEKQNETHT